MAIKTLTPHHPFARYEVDRAAPLRIDSGLPVPPFDDQRGDGGSIRIRCASEIVVGPKGAINSSDCGLSVVDCTADSAFPLKFGALSSSSESTTVGRGGGVVALLSPGGITNFGTLSSNGSSCGEYGGGTICISTDGAFINRGLIECEPSGRILIRCRKFFDSGTISPDPEVVIVSESDENEFTVSRPLYSDITRLLWAIKSFPNRMLPSIGVAIISLATRKRFVGWSRGGIPQCP